MAVIFVSQCSVDNKSELHHIFQVLSCHSAAEQVSVREFFSTLVTAHIDTSLRNTRMDFLAAHPAHNEQGQIIATTLCELLEVS